MSNDFSIDARTKTVSAVNRNGLLLDANPRRVGVMIYNNTGSEVYVLLSENQDADSLFFSYAIPQKSQDTTLFDIRNVWKGRITYQIKDQASGSLHVTEFIDKNRR
ncbi:MAG: hypothetical protein LAT67_05130 [Balneolales bacterium]|nr:hypothetical protein [Balneolales bacterium]